MKYENYSVLSSIYIKEKPEFLRRSLQSMVEQTVLTNDYVIVKDGPITTELEQVLSDFTSRYRFIHVYGYETNKGLGYALNYGLKYCKNEIVARMDTDDISLPERCEKELNVFNSNAELDIVGTFIYEFTETEECITALKTMPINPNEIKDYAKRRNPFNHPSVMFKKSSVQKNGGYPEGIRGEDFFLFTKMIFNNCKGYNIPEPLLKYRAITNQFERRTSKADSDAVIKVMKSNYKNGYISLLDLLYVIVAQNAGRLLPKKFAKIIYKKLYRSVPPKQAFENHLYICNTPYHLMLSCNRWKNGDVLIYIGNFKNGKTLKLMIDNTFNNNTLFAKDFYYYRTSVIRLLKFRKNQKYLLKMIKGYFFGSIILFNDIDPVAQWIIKRVKCSGDIIIIEEGIGVYRNTKKRHEKMFKIAGKIFFGRSFENVRRIGESSAVSKIICSEPEKLSLNQSKKKIEVLEELDYSAISKELRINRISGYSWFIGQPLVEDGIVSEQKYLSYIKIIKEVEKKKGKKLILKPHPRENLQKYNNIHMKLVSDSDVPVELLIDNSSDVNVFTIYSSAILNISKMKNVKSYVLYKIFDIKVNIEEDLFDKQNIITAHTISDIV